MSTPEQRKEDRTKAKFLINTACSKNQAAKDYLWDICEVWRRLDDIYDGDHEVTREQLMDVFEILWIRLPTNPFFVRHQDILTSQHISMWNAWIASNLWAGGDETERIYSHVWRYTIHELVPLVALLTQGHTQMAVVSGQVRQMYKTKLGEE